MPSRPTAHTADIEILGVVVAVLCVLAVRGVEPATVSTDLAEPPPRDIVAPSTAMPSTSPAEVRIVRLGGAVPTWEPSWW